MLPRTGQLAMGALAVGLVFGIALAPSPVLVLACLAATVAGSLGLLMMRRARSAAVTIGAATVLLRLLLGGVTSAPPVPPPTASTEGDWVGVVTTLGSTTGGQQRSLLVVGAADPAIAARDGGGPWRTYAWLPRYPQLVPGDRIAFTARLEPVAHDGSELTGYLEAIDAVATARIRAMTLVGDGGGILGMAESIRRLADESLARVVPEPMAGLASAVLVGRRDRVAREVTDAFTATGLSHVVAISGWNIALIGAVIGGSLAALGFGRRQRTVVIVIALGLFTLLAGGGASVIRAALMGGVALVAREVGRPGTAAAALGLATWSLLVLDPAMATDIGFQLSVAATAGLLAWGDRLTGRMLGSHPGTARRWLAGSLGVSLAAQAATLPLVLFHFGRLSLVSPLANLVIAPIVAPAMLVGSLCLVAGLVVGIGAPAVIAAPFAFLGWLVLGSMVAVAGTFAALPYASVELPPGVSAAASLAFALAVGVVVLRGRGRPGADLVPADHPSGASPPRSARSVRLVVLLVVVVTGLVGAGMLVRATQRDSRLVVTALDVGQGDSILVEGPRGGRLLLDGGPDPDRLLMVLDRNVPAWDRRIDLVILTHPHEDHVAGLAMLLARYRVGGIAENGMLGAGPGDAAFRERLAAMGIATSRLAAGDRLSLDGVRADVRWPIRGEVPERAPSEGRRINDTSVVLDLRFGERRLLLTGDIEDDVDPRLLAAGISEHDRRLDVLKVAHHGSRTATSDEWLDALRPRVALVSAGVGNPYGHPAPRTMERLEAHGARVLRTDLDGDLEVSTDGRDLRVATSGGRTVATAEVVPTARTASLASATAAFGSVAQGRFLCAIPLSPARLAALDATPAPNPPRGRRIPREGPPGPVGTPTRGDPLLPCYDRTDGDPLATRSGRTAALVPAGLRDPGALHGHRRRGVVPRARDGSRGPPGGPGARRGRGAAA